MIIDVSKYQNKIDWNKLKSNSQIEGVYIKATEGIGYTDPTFKDHVIGANSVSLPIGFYHFASLNSTNVIIDSTNETKYFYSIIKGYSVKLPYVLDIEKKTINLSKEDIEKWISNFKLTLNALGLNDFSIYSYTPFLNENLNINHRLGNIPLWIAAYTSTLKLPNGWSSAWLWQYSSSGSIDGVQGNVDLNKRV